MGQKSVMSAKLTSEEQTPYITFPHSALLYFLIQIRFKSAQISKILPWYIGPQYGAKYFKNESCDVPKWHPTTSALYLQFPFSYIAHYLTYAGSGGVAFEPCVPEFSPVTVICLIYTTLVYLETLQWCCSHIIPTSTSNLAQL